MRAQLGQDKTDVTVAQQQVEKNGS